MLNIDNTEHGFAIASELGLPYVPSRHTVLSRVNSAGEFMGGFLYTDYTGVCITVHMYGAKPLWMSRSILWVVFDYPFIQLGVKKLLSPVSSGNRLTIDIACRLGFREAARVPAVYKDGDLVLLETTPDECRWLRRPSRMQKAA